jgi:myo-inositol-1(or 4)-monophosphatase
MSEAYRKSCEHAARSAGKLLLELQHSVKMREKGPKDLVSEADFAAQAMIKEILGRDFPEIAFVGEEDEREHRERVQGQSAPYWVVDPLDGTTNYLHKMPAYAVSIALVKNNRIECGTVYDPVLNEFFWAAVGTGATLNGAPIRVSDCTLPEQALVAASFAPQVQRGSPEITRFVEAVHHCQGVRRLGSAALNLAYVACGRLDAYWATSVKLWDVAAGLLLVQEAGGSIIGIDGGHVRLEKPELLACSSSVLQTEMMRFLR